MPNYKLSYETQRQFKRKACELLDSTLALRLLDFPLTAQEAFDCLWPRDLQEAWIRVREAGVHHYDANSLDLNVKLPDAIVRISIKALDMKFPYFSDTRGMPNKRVFIPDALSPAKHEAFYAWLTPAFKYARQMRVAKGIVDNFFNHDRSGSTLASAVKRWPGMSVVAQQMGDPWEQRLRQLPRNMEQFDWPRSGRDYDWFVDNEEKIEVIDGLFTAAQMHGPVVDKAPVQCTIDDWTMIVVPEPVSA